jgi:iron complex outermembrane recepter protein
MRLASFFHMAHSYFENKGRFAMGKYRHCKIISLSLAAIIAGRHGEGFAQQVPIVNDSSPVSSTSEEIIVTATKQAIGATAQKTPIAITAVGEAQISRTFAITIQDLGKLAPNVQLSSVGTYPGFANFLIRGIGVNNSVRSVDPTINIFQDGMVLGYQVGTLLDTFDTESVEILRGPQGILFGKNSTGGIVSLRTRRPNEDFGVRLEATVGNFGRRDISASVEGALVPDKVRAKIAFLSRNSNGFFHDRNGGTFAVAPANPSGLQPVNPQSDQSGSNLWAIKPIVVADFSDQLQLTLTGQYYHDVGGGATTRDIQPGGSVGAAFTVFGYTPPSDPSEINHNLVDEGHRLTEYHTVAQFDLTTDAGIFTSVSAYRHVNYWSSLDLDGTPFVISEFPDNNENSKQFSQELRFASKFSDSIELIAGAYYLNVKEFVEEKRHFATATPYTRGQFNQKASNIAGFANLTYSVTPDLKLIASGRYTHEKKTISVVPLGACTVNFAICPTTATNLSKSWNDFSPKLGVQFQATPDILAYASWTKGFRSGNFNARTANPAAIGPTEPESVQSYEAGVKTDLFDRKLRFNVTGFYMNYDNIQKTVFLPAPGSGVLVQTLNNAATAKVYGIELETKFSPTKSLLFEGNLGWTHARYKSFKGLDVNRDGAINAVDEQLASNLKFDRLADYTYLLAGTYTVPVENADLSLRVSWDWRSKVFLDVLNTPQLAQPAYGVLDASIRYAASKYSVSVFAHNLNKSVSHEQGSAIGGYQYHGGLADATWGIELKTQF